MFRFVYNVKEVLLLKNKEIGILKKTKKILNSKYSKDIKRKKALKKQFNKRDLRYLSIGRALSIVEGPVRAKEEKEQKIKEIEIMMESVSNISLREYFNYINGKNIKSEEKNDEENSLSTIDEIEERLEKMEAIIKRNRNIKYNFKIKF